MLLRIAIVLAGIGLVGYRVALAWEIRKARRAGDRRREQRLRSRGFGLYRWVAAALLVFLALLSLVVWSGSH